MGTKVFLRDPCENTAAFDDLLKRLTPAQKEFFEKHRGHMKVEIESNENGTRVHCKTCKVVSK